MKSVNVDKMKLRRIVDDLQSVSSALDVLYFELGIFGERDEDNEWLEVEISLNKSINELKNYAA